MAVSFPRPFLSLLPRRSCLSCTHLHYARTEVAIALLFPNGLPPSSAPSAPFFRDIDIALRIDGGDAFSRAETDRARADRIAVNLSMRSMHLFIYAFRVFRSLRLPRFAHVGLGLGPRSRNLLFRPPKRTF